MLIETEMTWHMAHRLMFHKGDCKNIHGHTYKVVVCIEGDVGRNGMVRDFSDVKQKLKCIIDDLDHCIMINSMDLPLKSMLFKLSEQIQGGLKIKVIEGEPTAENLSQHIYNNLDIEGVVYVEVWETTTSRAIYIPGDEE
jgi:6-pyruvoyltetrahydropterin/6-carboxytetrahydropterin synthase